MSLALPTVVQLVVSFNFSLQWGMTQEYSFTVIDFILCFRWGAFVELGGHYAERAFCVFLC